LDLKASNGKQMAGIMKIALTTIGSRGDIQPYIALGKELEKNGHSATILTHPWAEAIIKQYDLAHHPVGDNIDIYYAAKQFVENSSNNLKGFRFALNFIFDNLKSCHLDFLEALKDYDLVIGHGIAGEAEADILGKPFISVSIAPMGLPKEYWKSKNVFREFNVWVSDKVMGAIFGKPYKNFRNEVGAPPKRVLSKHPYLALIPMPSFLQKPHPNWKETTEITGYFFADTPDNFVPSEALLNFLNNGEIPILITFGSMFHKKSQTEFLFKTVCNAVSQSGSRAILIMPDLNKQEITVPENVFIVSQTPYSWLLNHVRLVVHHFGFGTTAEVLRAGLPSIPIPHIFDQKIRASKIHKLGYASKPIDIKSMDEKILSEAIVQVSSNEEKRHRCFEAGKLINDEQGLQSAVRLINEYVKKLNHTA
jgi:sterol 3beta-glucosyltransferase